MKNETYYLKYNIYNNFILYQNKNLKNDKVQVLHISIIIFIQLKYIPWMTLQCFVVHILLHVCLILFVN